MKMKTVEPHEWWASLSQGERRLICSLMGLLRGAKRSQLQDVANAAAKWERGIACFIKVRLIGEKQKTESRKLKWTRRQVSISVETATSPRKAESRNLESGNLNEGCAG